MVSMADFGCPWLGFGALGVYADVQVARFMQGNVLGVQNGKPLRPAIRLAKLNLTETCFRAQAACDDLSGTGNIVGPL